MNNEDINTYSIDKKNDAGPGPQLIGMGI
jgi:hypothetical protein